MRSLALFLLLSAHPSLEFLNHNHPVLDAHNCYPYDGNWTDRIDRALRTGRPIAIEQDLAWQIDPATGTGRVVLSHTRETNGQEPTLKEYFFERVRPIVEQALRDREVSRWPLIILHLDIKDNRRELLTSVWNLLGQYESWLTTARKTSQPGNLAPLEAKPLLVLTEENDTQEEIFFQQVPVGANLRVFGSAHTKRISGGSDPEKARAAATLAPEDLLSESPTNYRRWWNNSWAVVEEGGQHHAGDWTASDDLRLRALVNHAHKLGYWIRFYTLDGFAAADSKGWDEGYNFGSREAVAERWKAALNAGVDLIATDQYEDLADLLH